MMIMATINALGGSVSHSIVLDTESLSVDTTNIGGSQCTVINYKDRDYATSCSIMPFDIFHKGNTIYNGEVPKINNLVCAASRARAEVGPRSGRRWSWRDAHGGTT